MALQVHFPDLSTHSIDICISTHLSSSPKITGSLFLYGHLLARSRPTANMVRRDTVRPLLDQLIF